MHAKNSKKSTGKDVSDRKGAIYESDATGERLLVPYDLPTGAVLSTWVRFNLRGDRVFWTDDLTFVGASSTTEYDVDLGEEGARY